ncbi:hypothetical protein BDN72DRAFT_219162 [Pluteus cervinus]|uniref:Uncharacterized protein n=1 Tax=Pluteus cervinus TaxID=181527 RepID=A0ACD3AH61_9AGAR|nr:hypothetical protein BDN72DRAFT_219162 [Pluteus cervinus]
MGGDRCNVGGEGGKALVDPTSMVVPISSALDAAAPVLELGRVDEDEEEVVPQVASPGDTSPPTSRSNTFVDTLPTSSMSFDNVEPLPKVHVEEAPVGSAHVDSYKPLNELTQFAVRPPSLSPPPETKEMASPQRNSFLLYFASSAPLPAINRSSPPPASTFPSSIVSRPGPPPLPSPQPTVAAAHLHSRSWSTPPSP